MGALLLRGREDGESNGERGEKVGEGGK